MDEIGCLEIQCVGDRGSFVRTQVALVEPGHDDGENPRAVECCGFLGGTCLGAVAHHDQPGDDGKDGAG